MVDFISNLFSNNTDEDDIIHLKKYINEDLIAGRKLQTKRHRMVKKMEKNTKLMEGFSPNMPLPTEDKNEFNNMKTSQTNMQRETSSLASLLKNTLSDYTRSKETIKDCVYYCNEKFGEVSADDEINIVDSKKACLAGCNLSEVYLDNTKAKGVGIKGEKLSSCKALQNDGPQFCSKFVATNGCLAKNNYNGTKSLTAGPAGCNTNIPSNVSGLCFCKDGSIKARVDCGHANFNCNEVCQPQGKPYIYRKPQDCEVSGWGEWSKCNKTCGKGTQKRTRVVTTEPGFGGKSCPSLTDTRACEIKVCMEPKCVPNPMKFVPNNATSCRGGSCSIEGQTCPPNIWPFSIVPGSSITGYCCGGGKWQTDTCDTAQKRAGGEKSSGYREWEGKCAQLPATTGALGIFRDIEGIGCEGWQRWPNGGQGICQTREVPAPNKTEGFSNVADKNPNTAHHIITGDELVDQCSSTQTRTTNAMGEAVNLHKTFGRYNDQQSVVNNKANQLQKRINEILTSRGSLGHKNNSSSQKLMSELAQYQNEYQTLKRLNVGQDTLKGMAEDSLLKHGSSRIKYLVWLGLAICVLMVVIRKTK
jgi:hypothetical protein